jgi:thioredoxin-related protein
MIGSSGRRVFACVLFTLVLNGAPVHAQEVQWRTDYNAAARESAEKRRPLFLDVGKEVCPYCVKLDISTFRDPTLVRLFNENFIPVKVDGERNAVQVQGQLVQSFPTLIFIGTDNKVLLVHEGYLDAASLLPQVQQILASQAPKAAAKPAAVAAKPAAPAAPQTPAAHPPKTPAQAQPQSPAKPAAPAQAQAPAKAAATTKAPSQPAPKESVPNQTQTPSTSSQGQASSQSVPKTLAAAPSTLAKTGSTAPFQADTTIGPSDGRRPVWPGPRESAKSSAQNYQPVEERAARAKQLLSLAQEDYQRQQWLACLEHCKTLMLLYPDVQESLDARQLALRIKSNPDLLERLGRDLTENLAEVYWELAQTKLRQNQAAQAIPYLEKIVQNCPGTRFTPAAQDYLSRITSSAGRPTRTSAKTH